MADSTEQQDGQDVNQVQPDAEAALPAGDEAQEVVAPDGPQDDVSEVDSMASDELESELVPETPEAEAAAVVDDIPAPDAEVLETGAPDVLADTDAAPEGEPLAAASGEAPVDDVDGDAPDADAQTDEALATETAADGDDAGMEEVSEEELRRPIAELKTIVEAMIFASPEPLTPKALLKLLDTEPKEDVLAALEELKTDYLRPSGLQLVEVAGGFQIVTRADLHEWVRRLFHERSTAKLSAQALESLAVIAYRQPITAMEVAEVRGVNGSGVLNTLLERHLIKIVGRKQVVGRPFMYATTKEFLIRFGLKDLTDLPKVEDMAESLGIESSLLVEQTPPEEQLPLSEPDHAVLAEEPVDAPDDFDEPVDDEPTLQ